MNHQTAARRIAGLLAASLLVVGLFSGCAPAAKKRTAPPPTPTRTPTREPASFPTPTYTPSGTPDPTPTDVPSRTPGPTPSALVRAFVAKITSPDFQFEGTLAMSLSMSVDGGTSLMQMTGTMKVKGTDDAMALASTYNGKTETSETREIGPAVYTRTNGGQWTRTTRTVPAQQSAFSTLTTGQISDTGVATFNGRSLHALSVSGPFSLGSSVGSVTQVGITSGNGVTLIFWATSNGTPAGLTYRMAYKSGTESMDTSVIYTFDKLSGVTITAPI